MNFIIFFIWYIFYFNDSMYSNWHGLCKFVKNLAIQVRSTPSEFCRGASFNERNKTQEKLVQILLKYYKFA